MTAVPQSLCAAFRIARRCALAFGALARGRLHHAVTRIGLVAVLALFGATAWGAEHRFQLLLDVDNSPATGCTIPTSKGTAVGVDQVWTTVVTTTPSSAVVTRIERQACVGGALAAPVVHATAGWSAGIGNGTSGTAAIETFVPLSFLPSSTVTAVVASVNATGGQDATAAFTITLSPTPGPGAGAPLPIPLSREVLPLIALLIFVATYRYLRDHRDTRALLVLVAVFAVSGLVWAATATLDGNVSDWQGIAPDAGNPAGSAPVDANIVAVFHQTDATRLFVRIDADVRLDTVGNQPPAVSAGADQTITLPSTATLAGSASDDGLPSPPATLTTTWSKLSGPGTVTFGNAANPVTSAAFSQSGTYALRLSATDGALSASDDVNITVNDSGNRIPTAVGDIAGTTPGSATQIDVLDNDRDADGDALSVIAFSQGAHGTVTCAPAGSCRYTPANGFAGQDTFTYTVADGHGGQAQGTVTVIVAAADTTLAAPAMPQGIASLLGPSTAFLYTGASPVQLGVTPGTIRPFSAAVLRGKVTTRGGSLLPGVDVTVLGHPEYGHTITRSNGYFDIAVNGGGLLTLSFSAPGLLPVQKQVYVPWQDFVAVPTVALVPLDTRVTAIAANASTVQFHRASDVADADGTRRAVVLFAPGTTATMTLPNGTTQPLPAMHVRATEYTVGPNGPAAMPAGLPPLSGYTYCVELSVDEALAAGAVSVTFSQPVVTYVDNFLHFPVGVNVPVGTYDRTKGAWVPNANGRIVKVIAVTGGVAEIDSDGDNVADNGLALSVEERRSLGSFYAAGQTLSRVPVAHFSPSDSNWRLTIPDDATSPGESGAGPDPNEPEQDPICREGSVVECENQVLGQAVPIVGTPYVLNYRSDRVPGQLATRTIRLSGASVPASLASIDLHLSVAGRDFHQSFAAGPNQQTTFVWDRKDAYGRQLVGGQTLSVKIDYNYPTTYTDPGPLPSAFNSIGGVSLGANPSRQQVQVSQSFTTTIGEGLTDARTLGLGGWSLNVHNVYDPNARVAHLGSGLRRRAGSIARTLSTIDLPGQSILFDVEAGPDGSVYVALPHGDQIIRIAHDGTQSVVAGNGTEGFSGDGGPAILAKLGDPTGIALGPDGSLYIAEQSNFRVRKVAPDGTITTIAGTGVPGSNGDGGPATLAQLSQPERIAVAADSTIYLLDGQRVRRINNDGIITTVAGTGAVGGTGDGGPATLATLNASSISVAPDGGFYIADFDNHRVRRVTSAGIIDTVVDYSSSSAQPLSIRPTPDGSLMIALQFPGARTPQVDLLRPDRHVITIAGGGPDPIQENIPATQVALEAIRAVALGPDGGLYIVQGNGSSKVLRVSPALPGFEGDAIFIPSANGAHLYVFDDQGRHLQTRSALTGTVLVTFGYDGNGRLATITEKTGGTDNVTTITHDTAGNPTTIVAPFGQVTHLAVDANGFVNHITNPAGEAVDIASDGNGLMTAWTDARGKTAHFTFDGEGRLLQDVDPLGGSQALARTTVANQFTVARTTGLGRVTTFRSEQLDGKVHRRTKTDPDGSQLQTTEAIDAGTMSFTASNGVTGTRTSGADPRFGMSAPLLKAMSIAMPSGKTLTSASSLAVTLSNPADPLSLTALTSTSTIDGRTTTSQYNAATRTYVTTTPQGRTSTTAMDAFGRMVSRGVDGLFATTATYDSRGRLLTLTRGSGAGARTMSFAYNAAGFLQSSTDALGRSAQFTYDAAGRITRKTFPDGQAVDFAYDAAGNVVAVTPPGRPAHALGYSDRDELLAVTPPAVGGGGNKAYTYDLDRQVASIARGDARTVNVAYDGAGRLSTRRVVAGGVTAGTDTFTYDGAGRVTSVNAGTSGVTLSYAYDGALVNTTTWAGAIAGNVSRTYDDALRVASESVDGAHTIAFTYDADDALIAAGPYSITRDAQHALPTATTLGVVGTVTAFDGFAEVTSSTASANGSAVLAMVYTRDALGRLTQRTETIGGVATAWSYGYDTNGQLLTVKRNGSTVEAYAYDANGNRTGADVGGSSVTATYDNQDRLVQYGATTFTYNGAGDLSSRTSGAQVTQYQYDPFGNLVTVTLPSGVAIAYLVDGLDRRVGKKVNGTLVKGFLYADPLRVAAELDGAGNVVSRFIYAGGTTPVAMTKGAATFRLLKDQVGSIRLVVDAASGAIVQRLDYDTFGNVVADTNPGFQPFGFMGGLYDADTGLVRFGARDYDATTGRWTVKDPAGFAGGDTNFYRFVHNDPLNRVDSTGRDDVSIIAELRVQEAVEDVARDPTFVHDTDSFLKYVPGKLAGDLRNFGFVTCNIVSFGFACNPNDEPTSNEVCTGIAGTAKGIIEANIKAGKYQYVTGVDVISRKGFIGTDHTAVLVHLVDGDAIIVDWHATLDPAHPSLQTFESWCNGGCL